MKKLSKNKKTRKQQVKSTQLNQDNLCNSVFVDNRYIDDYDRLRAFALELYAPPKYWGTLLSSAEHYAYIYHDKDIKADGTPKLPHYHLLLRFSNAKTKSAVRKLTDIDKLDKDTTILYQKLLNPKGAFNYLTHETKEARADNKTVYDSSCVICDNAQYWSDIVDYNTSVNEDFVSDLLSGAYDTKSLAIKYGRDYMKNLTRYNQFVDIVRTEEARKQTLEVQNEFFITLKGCDNASPLNEKTSSEFRKLLTDYVASLIIEAYRIEKNDDMFNDVTPGGVARSFLKMLNDEIIGKVFDLLK